MFIWIVFNVYFIGKVALAKLNTKHYKLNTIN